MARLRIFVACLLAFFAAPAIAAGYPAPKTGEWIAKDFKNVLPPKGRVYTSMEEMIHQFKTVTEWCPPKGEVYVATEAANGELGFYLVSAGRQHAYRVKIRSPSFVNLQSLRPMCLGGYFSDVVAVIASLHFILGESDR